MNAQLTRFLSILGLLLGLGTAATGSQAGEQGSKKAAPEFTESFLSDPANLAVGKEVWVDQCRHCHGKSAYPGKAPKLKPRRYTLEFVYDRVTNGFRKMPAWDEVYSEHELMSVSAWIMSEDYSP